MRPTVSFLFIIFLLPRLGQADDRAARFLSLEAAVIIS
jgi:hypothetical protein